MSEMEKLLRAALFALNSVGNRGLDHPDFKDTYSLARAISRELNIQHATKHPNDENGA